MNKAIKDTVQKSQITMTAVIKLVNDFKALQRKQVNEFGQLIDSFAAQLLLQTDK